MYVENISLVLPQNETELQNLQKMIRKNIN